MGFRKLVLFGGTALAVRQGIGMVLGLANLFFVVRIIGPEAYGIFALGTTVLTFAAQILGIGLGVYLIRHPYLGPENLNQAFTYLVMMSLLGLALAPWMALVVQGLAHLATSAFLPLLFLYALLPVQLLALAPLSQLERRLDYRSVAGVELIGQVAALFLAVPLALWGKGVWAPVAGLWGQQLVLLAGYWLRAGYRPRLLWRWALFRDMLAYGLGYSASTWVWQARLPLVLTLVSRYVGTEAAGLVALAGRLAEPLAFAKGVAWRLSIPVLSRLQGDQQRLLKAMEEGMLLQTLAVGAVFLGFTLVAPLILPILLGSAVQVLEVFPFVAIATLFNALFSLHFSVLHIFRYNLDVFFFHLVYLAFLGGSLVLFLPKVGLLAYGLAELVALLGYVVVYLIFLRRIGRLFYLLSLGWAVALGIAFLLPHLGIWALLPLSVWTIVPWSWGAWHIVRRFVSGR